MIYGHSIWKEERVHYAHMSREDIAAFGKKKIIIIIIIILGPCIF
jgi:hypothetical protein